MRRVTALFVLVIAVTVLLYGQKLQNEGKAWLDANPDPPALNVTGLWEGGDWGIVSLSQPEGGRRVIGSGDGWDISGVVSGKDVYLLFWHEDIVAYSAKMTAEGPSQLTGTYAKGILSPQSRTRPIKLTK